MDEFTTLLILSFLMFLLSIIFGYLPMSFKMSENVLETISIIGAGFMLGTALIIIIPEGLIVLLQVSNMLQTNNDSNNHNEHPTIIIPNHNTNINPIDKPWDFGSNRMLLDNLLHFSYNSFNSRELFNNDKNNIDQPLLNNDNFQSHDHSHNHIEDPLIHSVFAKMGIIFAIGFIFMMAIEKLSGDNLHEHHEHHSRNEHEHEHLNNEESTEIINATSNNNDKIKSSAMQQSKTTSFMIGLLTHAATDGIALGAVSAEGHSQSLSLIVFIALMGHKVPSAISLTAFLKRKAHPRQQIIKQLVIFSLAAPVFAILTYVVLDFILMDTAEWLLNSSEALGWALIFSAGTFLYVTTMHMLPEVKTWRNDNQYSWKDIAFVTIGCILPSFIQHSH